MTGKQQERRAEGGSKSFSVKVDELVGRVIPGKWFATAFVGAAGAALLFLILMIVGFTRSPEEAAQKAREKAEGALKSERVDHRETAKKLREAENTKRKAERELVGATKDVDGAKRLQERAEAAFKGVEGDLVKLREQFAAERRGKQELERKVRTFDSQARKDMAGVERERDVEKKKAAANLKRAENAEKVLAEVREQYGALRGAKDAQTKIDERALATFTSIMDTAGRVEDLEKRLETLGRLRDASLADIAGTTYAPRLDKEISKVEKEIKQNKRAAATKAAKDAKGAYSDAMLKVKMAKTHEEQMEILKAAKAELAGSNTKYEVNIHKEIEKREAAHKGGLARAVYDEVMKKLRENPKAHEENLQALKEAIEKTQGTRYAGTLQRQIDAKEKTLKADIALAAYNELRTSIKNSPTAYDENIAAAEKALVQAKETRYEANVNSILTSQTRARLDAIGREAFDKAREQISGSEDRAANVAALEELKAKAAGSVWAAKIDKYLAREKKLLEREQGE